MKVLHIVYYKNICNIVFALRIVYVLLNIRAIHLRRPLAEYVDWKNSLMPIKCCHNILYTIKIKYSGQNLSANQLRI